MVAYTYAMPSGIPGNVTRVTSYPNVESQILDQTTPPTSFGVPVKMVSGKIQPIGSGDVAGNIYGILVRPYPTSGNGTDGLGVAVPNKAFPADVLVTGYINVLVNGATAPTKDSTVYVRVAAATTGKPLGGIEAAADGGNTIIMGNSYFTGGRDASNNAEICFNV